MRRLGAIQLMTLRLVLLYSVCWFEVGYFRQVNFLWQMLFLIVQVYPKNKGLIYAVALSD